MSMAPSRRAESSSASGSKKKKIKKFQAAFIRENDDARIRFTTAVVKSRHKFRIKVPDTTGPSEFIRTFRAHQNTLEYYTLSLACLWISSIFFHPASVTYMGYLIGREMYFWGYIKEADRRVSGFYISINFLIIMFAMSIWGVVHKLLRYYADIDIYQLVCNHIPILKVDL